MHEFNVVLAEFTSLAISIEINGRGTSSLFPGFYNTSMVSTMAISVFVNAGQCHLMFLTSELLKKFVACPGWSATGLSTH